MYVSQYIKLYFAGARSVLKTVPKFSEGYCSLVIAIHILFGRVLTFQFQNRPDRGPSTTELAYAA